MNGETRIEQVCEPNPPGLGNQPESICIALEDEWFGRGLDGEARLVVPEDELLCDLAAGGPICERHTGRSVPSGGDHGYGPVRAETDDDRSRRQILKLSSLLARSHAGEKR